MASMYDYVLDMRAHSTAFLFLKRPGMCPLTWVQVILDRKIAGPTIDKPANQPCLLQMVQEFLDLMI